jgi:hypothetical protein
LEKAFLEMTFLGIDFLVALYSLNSGLKFRAFSTRGVTGKMKQGESCNFL